MTPRFSIRRWLRMRLCAFASRHRRLPGWSCGDPDCPRCNPDVAQAEEGEALYRDWLEAEKELRRH
jgi:hypothetical protein